MAIDERLRSELQRVTFEDLDVHEALRNAVAGGRRRVRRRRLASSAALLAVVVAVGATALTRLDDPRSASVTATGRGHDRWTPMADAPIRGRSAHTLVWTGHEVIAWGGVGGPSESFADGAAYDPVTDRWRPIASAPLAGRGYHGAVWTGTEMVVWGGADATGKGFVDGAAYDPATDRWRLIAPGPLSARFRPVMSWTGREVLVVGGTPVQDAEVQPIPAGPGAPPPQPMIDGAAYDPATDRWRRIPPGPIGESAPWTPAAWTGQQLIVMAGGPAVFSPPGLPEPAPSSGLPIAAYRPSTDSWERLPNVPVPMNSVPSLAWTGTELIAVAGSSESGDLGTAVAHDPGASAWTSLPSPPHARVQAPQTAVWTGEEVVLAGGDGLAFDPSAGRWRRLPHLDTPRLLEEMKIVWAGDVVVAWGGFVNGGTWDEGATYRPTA